MPNIEENDLNSLYKRIDYLRKESQDLNKKIQDLEHNYDAQTEQHKGSKRKARISNIVLSLLTGIGLALAFFFFNKKGSFSSDVNIAEIQKLEATRILDSIGNTHSNDLDLDAENNNTLGHDDTFFDDLDTQSENISGISTDESVNEIKQAFKGEKVYSVQVAIFSDNNHAVLSESIAGIYATGDLFKYSIGLFKTLDEAQKFRNELVGIGFNDAFIASYIDGKRQAIEKPN